MVFHMLADSLARCLTLAPSSCLYLVYENSIVSWFEFVEDVGHGSYLNSNSFFFSCVAKHWHHTGINLKLPSFYLTISHFAFYLHTNNYYSQNIALILFIFHCIITLSLLLPAHPRSKRRRRKKRINDAGNLMKNKIQRCPKWWKETYQSPEHSHTFISLCTVYTVATILCS